MLPSSINGVSLLPAEKSIAFGKRVIEWGAAATVAAIQKAVSQ